MSAAAVLFTNFNSKEILSTENEITVLQICREKVASSLDHRRDGPSAAFTFEQSVPSSANQVKTMCWQHVALADNGQANSLTRAPFNVLSAHGEPPRPQLHYMIVTLGSLLLP